VRCWARTARRRKVPRGADEAALTESITDLARQYGRSVRQVWLPADHGAAQGRARHAWPCSFGQRTRVHGQRREGLDHRRGITGVGAKTAFIEPGSPWENGCVESFNGKLRDELLNREVFNTLAEAKVLIEGWRRHDNTVRPHLSLRYRPPAPETLSLHDRPPPIRQNSSGSVHALPMRH
jgi:transposase InsO family protein